MEGDVSAFIVGCLLRGLSDSMFVKVRLFSRLVMCCAEAVVGMVCADSCRVAVSCDRSVRYGSRFFSFRLPLLS